MGCYAQKDNQSSQQGKRQRPGPPEVPSLKYPSTSNTEKKRDEVQDSLDIQLQHRGEVAERRSAEAGGTATVKA